jgi:hypothetical protein
MKHRIHSAYPYSSRAYNTKRPEKHVEGMAATYSFNAYMTTPTRKGWNVRRVRARKILNTAVYTHKHPHPHPAKIPLIDI